MSEERDVHLLFLSPKQIASRPQIGTPVVMPVDAFRTWLSRHTVDDEKTAAGAWAGGRYVDNRRARSALVGRDDLVLDFDEGGDVARVAEALGLYSAIVHATFRSTVGAPRCRGIVLLAESIDADTYDAVHAVIRGHLASVGIVADAAAKDCCRMSYLPVRRPGDDYPFRIVNGDPLDARAVLAAQPPPAPRPESSPIDPKHADVYVRGALRRAHAAVASAPEGERNALLNREAYSLGRLAIDDSTIVMTLSDAGRVCGLSVHEIDRTIRSALQARRGAA